MLSRDHFIDALDDSDTRLRIQQAHPKTLDDAVKLAVELEAFYIADKQRDKPSSVRNFAISESSEVSGQIKTLSDVEEELRQDTDANVTILNKKVYDSLSDGNKVVLRPTHTNMKLADGKPLKVRGIADIDEDIDCIIGFDFMKQNICCIDVANNTITVNKEEISCAVLNTQGVRCCRVAVSETTDIPLCVEQIIPGNVIEIGCAPE
ncbi:unnamed protein product [Mytilus coruscus]|uniref:Uncharacterized protein n=1 Tax=Mytilus coruscus TaxID=42192 RepID=A0A6J8DI97_MYTCO|nr:unnamed protein product [Mytilus coruscus]